MCSLPTKKIQDEWDGLVFGGKDPHLCQKHPFLNKKEALSSVNRMGNKKEKAKRAYYCKKCGAWHITSTSRHEVSDIDQLITELKKLKHLITSGDANSKYTEVKALWGEVAKHFESGKEY